ncbi:MAG TPA: lytic transglycosylase domain-containing protein [Polyangiaceae bacterium]|nr:lytic transglycosylase domain-containing protein [Polyangiaceae bacterium]
MFGRDACALLLLVAACHRAPAVATATAEAMAPDASPPVSATSDTADAAPGPSAPWPTLVREERWDAAWRSLEGLAEPDRGRPEIRYVRARVALARDDAAAAVPLLDGLEASLPLLAEDIGHRRAEAMLSVGPFADAGVWFAARVTPGAQLQAARAFERAKDPKRARACADRVLSMEHRTRAQEAEARAIRVRIADPVGDGERSDARWLAVQGADLPAAADALATLARVDPAHPLSAKELLLRAKLLSDAGRADDAIHAVDLSAGAPDASTVSNRDRARARGIALYKARGRWSEAAKILTEAAGAGGPDAAENAFLAARALSRADRDEEAIRGYEDVGRTFSGSKWAVSAAYFVPYLRMLHGDWRDCARGFAAYLHDHPKGEEAPEARRDGALCALLDGDGHDTRQARVTLERLSDDEGESLAAGTAAELAALASLRDGDRTHALARWTDLARTRPLTWPGLLARARLAEAGAPLPPAIEPAMSPSAAGADSPPLAPPLPAPADTLHALGLDSDAEDALRDRESAVTAGSGARAPEALCAAYGQLGVAHREFQIGQSLPSALLATAPGPRTRWAWQCAFPRPYADVVAAAERDEKLPPGLLWAVMRQESGFDPDAISPARAVGLMQLLPETARPIAEELSLAHDDARLTSAPYAIAVAARYLHQLLDRFHGSVPLAVAAYNAGADPVQRWLSRAPGMQLDTFVARIPFGETRGYVARVMGNLARYEELTGGDAAVTRLDLGL